MMQWIRVEVKSGSIVLLPPMEFLINKQGENEVTTDPTTNYDRWTAYEDSRVYDSEKTEGDDGETNSAVAGPSGTQNTSSDAEETEVEVEASEAGDATTEQAIDEGDIPDYESYVSETPLASNFPTQATEEAEDGRDEYDTEDGGDEYDIEDGGYDYGVESDGNDYDSGSESDDEENEERNSFGFLISKKHLMGTTSGITATLIPGGVIKPIGDVNADAARNRANEVISPLTPTVPKKPFENEMADAAEGEDRTAVEETKPADANAGVEGDAAGSA